MISLVAGGNGLIGSAVVKHLWPGVRTYDLPFTAPPKDIEYDAFIDCARYDHQCVQVETWEDVIDHFKQQGWGKMILFSSIYGHKAPDFSIYPNTGVPETPLKYAMDKAAVEQAVRYLAQYLKPHNIQVNAIAPGGVYDGHSELFSELYRVCGTASMIGTRNLMPAIDALLHPDNVINGQVITVDGGWSL